MGRENSARAPTLHMSLLCCAALDHSVTSNSLSPHGLVAHQASLSMGFSRQEYWSGLPCHSPGDLPNLGIEPRSPTLQVDSLPSEPPGKPMNTKVGRLSLLQGIFPTQELNWDVLHGRWIIYRLSYQGSPYEFATSYDNHGLEIAP